MSAATRSTGRAAAQPAADRRTPSSVAAAAAAEPPYELVDIDRYAVFDNGIIGYVEVIPPLFICYSGHPYPTAVEVAQVFDFAQAVQCVRDAAPHSPDHGRSAA
jgi:hypothetical protein